MKNELTKCKRVGCMNIPSGKIDITDPCYNEGTHGRLDGVAVKPGKYRCYVRTLKGGTAKKWGRRVAEMKITHEDANLNSGILHSHYIGSVGVDAGLMSIYEVGTKPNYTDAQWVKAIGCLQKLEDVARAKEKPNAFVSDAFNLGENKKKQFWSSTGFGDGYYAVYGVNSHDPNNEDNIPDIIHIIFINPEDEE